MILEKSAGTIVYRMNKSQVEFLLLESPSVSELKKYFLWSFPKGKVEEGESDFETAKREVFEESCLSDLKFLPNEKISERFMYQKQGGLISKTVVYFLAEAKLDAKVKISDEHTNFAWADPAKAKTLIKTKGVRETLDKANNIIKIYNAQLKML